MLFANPAAAFEPIFRGGLNHFIEVDEIGDLLAHYGGSQQTSAARFLPYRYRLLCNVQDLIHYHSDTAIAVVENHNLDRIGCLVRLDGRWVQVLSEGKPAGECVFDIAPPRPHLRAQ